MIPPVPLLVRLAMSSACILVGKIAMRAAAWITPELEEDRASRRQEVSSQEQKL